MLTAEAQNNAHSVKKLDVESLKKFRDRFGIPIPDDKLEEVPEDCPSVHHLGLQMRSCDSVRRQLLRL